jgi:hypothetical protein
MLLDDGAFRFKITGVPDEDETPIAFKKAMVEMYTTGKPWPVKIIVEPSGPSIGDPNADGKTVTRRSEKAMVGIFCPKCRAENTPGVKFCAKCGSTMLRKFGATGWVALIVGILAFGFLGKLLETKKPPSSSSSTSSTELPSVSPTERKAGNERFSTGMAGYGSRIETPPLNPLDMVSIKKWNWRLDGFGTVMIASFTIQNDNAFDVKDVTIECELNAKSGTELGKSRQTVYEIIPANGSKRLADVNMSFVHSQASKASCRITDVVKVR